MLGHHMSKQALHFPAWVYKKGTGKLVDESGRYEAEAALVKSEEDLKKLEGVWVDSPVEAAAVDDKQAKKAAK